MLYSSVLTSGGSASPVGGAVTSWRSGAGSGPGCLAESYCMTADLRQFEPHDVVVMAYGHHVVVHAQRVSMSLPVEKKLRLLPAYCPSDISHGCGGRTEVILMSNEGHEV